MIVGLLDLQVGIHSQLLAIQRVHRYMHTEMFREAYNKASEEDRQILEGYIERRDKFRISMWVKNILKDDYDSYNMTELRRIAGNMGIKNYLHLSRDQLLGQIEDSHE